VAPTPKPRKDPCFAQPFGVLPALVLVTDATSSGRPDPGKALGHNGFAASIEVSY